MSTDLLPFDRSDEGVVTLTLTAEDKPVVVLNRAMIERIDRSLDAILDASEPSGFVLASRSRVFVAGADLGEIMALDEDGLEDYLSLGARVFGRISAMPCGTVAAINGAALGGGLEIAMHCDELLAAGTGERPYAIGLPEAGLKICPGWGGTNMLPARMGSSPSSAERAIRMTASGATFKSAEEASEAGLITRLVRAEDLLVEARKAARAIEKDTPRESPRFAGEHDVRDAVREGLEAFEAAQPDEVAAGGPESAVSRCVRAGLEEGWQAAIALERSELNRLRLSDAGREAIEAFFAKSSKR